VNSTETPGGSGIPAGWYDDPSGQGLRWWDGDAWTEHVHTAESAAAASEAGEGSGEGKPPRELVKLRESIRARGVKGVGIVLGAVVVVIVVIALLLSGGSEDHNANANPGTKTPSGKTAGASQQAQIKKIDKQLQNKNLSKAKKKQLTAQKKKLEKSAKKTSKAAKKKAKGGGKKAVSPGEEGN
jgi:Protein of unknown function (DUF2510)